MGVELTMSLIALDVRITNSVFHSSRDITSHGENGSRPSAASVTEKLLSELFHYIILSIIIAMPWRSVLTRTCQYDFFKVLMVSADMT